MKKLITGSVMLAGVLAISPQLAWAQQGDTIIPVPAGRYSDRNRSVDWNKQKDALQQALKLGETKDYYRRELEKMGWMVTAVNYDKPDYVEWEMVKGDRSYEVQIDLDKSNRASKIDVAANLWRADATKKAMRGTTVTAMGRGDARYSDRDRRGEYTKTEQQLEQALKPGQDKDTYRRELEKMGWTITSVNSDKPNYAEWEIVKGDQTYEVQIDLDKNSRASKVDVTTNMWQAEATERALGSRTIMDRVRSATQSSDSTNKSTDETRQVQKKLNDLGYSVGHVDGVWGPQTQAALRNFQQAKNLTATGRLDEKTKDALDLK